MSSVEKRGLLAKYLWEKKLYGGFMDDIGEVMDNMTGEEKEEYSERIVSIIKKYDTEAEIREVARQAELL